MRLQEAVLAQDSTEVVMSEEGNGWGITQFFIGLLLIPFTLVVLWKNEKKIVMYHKVIMQAK